MAKTRPAIAARLKTSVNPLTIIEGFGHGCFNLVLDRCRSQPLRLPGEILVSDAAKRGLWSGSDDSEHPVEIDAFNDSTSHDKISSKVTAWACDSSRYKHWILQCIWRLRYSGPTVLEISCRARAHAGSWHSHGARECRKATLWGPDAGTSKVVRRKPA